MAETLEPKVREILRNYIHEVKSLPNEAAKRSRFASLIAELFPGTLAITEYSRGVEKLIRIARGSGEKRGRADAYYGNAIIEFEKSLSATLEEAKGQLQEYVAGTWQKDKARHSLIAIASDGINWKIYRPTLMAGEEPTPETILLDELRDFKLTEDSLSAFWLWLTSILFRPQQIEPTAERFQLDFGSWSPLYRDGIVALKKAWVKVSDQSEAKLAFETWQRYLTVTYGRLTEDTTETKDSETGEKISELENLFLRHTYLASIARLMIWAALSRGRGGDDLRKVANDVFSGRYFQSKRLANLVDDDFFHWIRNPKAEKTLAPAWERILSHLTEYDLSLVREDVLKGVYQQLIDPQDRHDLGEYYTPDWLCERIVKELLPKHGFKSVLDPSCGSGSFLRATITHFLDHNSDVKDGDKLKLILGNVQGIDIHPVAVTIARATYVLALGRLVNTARKPIQIPIYLADSLFLPREVEADLLDKLSGVEIEYGGKKDRKHMVVPGMFIRSPELFDDTIAACTNIADEHAKTGKDSRATMERNLLHQVPELSKMLEYETILDALWTFTEGLADLIRQKKDSIWSFIIRNSYRPAMLKGQFDFIIGNPPWLAYGYITDPEYQKEVKQRARGDYEIAPESETHFATMELATLFLAHSLSTFSNGNGRIAFVMPRSVLNADQHQKLRERRYSPKAKLRLTGWWDLREVFPLFNVPSCVLFGHYDLSAPGQHKREALDVQEWSGRLPKEDVTWETAKHCLTVNERKGRLIWLGRRSALSTSSLGATAPSKPSKYQAAFKAGANLLPRAFYFVRFTDFDVSHYDPERKYWAETDPEQPKKKPYEDVMIRNYVEGRFICSTALARHLLPFVLLEPIPIVLPIEVNEKGDITLCNSGQLREDGYRDMAKWMEQAETTFVKKREDKSVRSSLAEWTDYQGQLTVQNLKQRHIVLYNAVGTNVSATHFDRHSRKLPFVVDQRTYWAAFRDAREAEYLTGILNSRTANQLIKPFQSMGLLGERDIHKKLLELPIPLFDADNPLHNKLADLSADAGNQAAKAVEANEFPRKMLARQRDYVRTHIQPILNEIDELVGFLLGST